MKTKTRIEWVRNLDGSQGYSINPIKGLCPVDCKDNQGKSYCYAAGTRGFYKRFKWNPEIRFEPNVFDKLPKKPSKIFVGSTMELFGDWVKPNWLIIIFTMVEIFPEHTFIFLTKCPQNLSCWSPFPKNVWCGVSITNQIQFDNAIKYLSQIEATVKFLSFEPLLSEINFNGTYDLSEIQWVIIGEASPIKQATMPKIEWIKEIIGAADETGIPIFLKNNLQHLFDFTGVMSGLQMGLPLHIDGSFGLRQEFPRTNL